jgi:flagellar basal-body rod modification protein FlgD
MGIEAVSGAGEIQYAGATEQKKTGINVDTETFLKLLVAQMKYQDPLEPQTNTEFVTQLAQMTSLSEMQSVRAALHSTQAYDLIGRTVYAEVVDAKTGETIPYGGVVDAVIMRAGVPYLAVGNAAVALSDVKFVFNTIENPEPAEPPEGDEETPGVPPADGETEIPDVPDETENPDSPPAQGVENEP